MSKLPVNVNASNPAVKRIMREYLEFQQSYHTGGELDVVAYPLDDNLFEWHFTVRGPSNSCYHQGLYHGRILLPSNYPFRPPDVVLLTPSGRFETNKKVCLSISSFHPQNWQPSWSIRTVLTALTAFLLTPAAGAIGSLDYSEAEKANLAQKSKFFTCQQCKISNAEIMDKYNKPHTEEAEEDENTAASTSSSASVSQPSTSSQGDRVPAPKPENAAPPVIPPVARASSPSTSSSIASFTSSSSASLNSSSLSASSTSSSDSASSSSTTSSSIDAAAVAASSSNTNGSDGSSVSSSSNVPVAPTAAVSASPSPVVSAPVSKLSSVTVFLSLLILLLLCRKFAGHLWTQQQQQHTMTFSTL